VALGGLQCVWWPLGAVVGGAGSAEALMIVDALVEVSRHPEFDIASTTFNFWHLLSSVLTQRSAPMPWPAHSISRRTRTISCKQWGPMSWRSSRCLVASRHSLVGLPSCTWWSLGCDMSLQLLLNFSTLSIPSGPGRACPRTWRQTRWRTWSTTGSWRCSSQRSRPCSRWSGPALRACPRET